MATITGLTELTAITDDDVFYVSQSGTDYKVKRSTIVKSVQDQLTAEINATNTDISNIESQYLKLSGGEMTGNLTLYGSPTESKHAVTKYYMDTAIAAKANAADTVLTGNPTAPTAAAGTNNTEIATTAFVKTAIDNSQFKYTALTSSTLVLTASDSGRVAVNVAGAVSITLPAISSLSSPYSVYYHIQDVGYNANATTQIITVNVAGGSGDTINNGATSATITSAGQDLYLYCDGSSKWYSRAVDQSASTTIEGLVELATDAEAILLADTSRALTASNMSAILNQELYQVTEIGAASYTVTEAESGTIYISYTTTGSVAVTLPDPNGFADPTKVIYHFVDSGRNASVNNVVFTPTAGTIGGAASYTLDKDGAGFTLINDKTNYIILNDTQKAADNAGTATFASVLANGAATGGNDFTLTTGDEIKAASGSGAINMDSSVIEISSSGDRATDNGCVVYLKGIEANSKAFLGVNDSTTTIQGITISNGDWVTGDAREIYIGDNAASNRTGPSIDTAGAIIGNGGASRITSGVTNSVVIGGATGVTASADDTVYIGDDLNVRNDLYIGNDTTITDAGNIILGTSTGTKIGTTTSQKLGFYNATPVVQPTALTAAETTITNAGTASDYAIQAMTNSSPFGFVTQAEGETVVEVVLNNQARINEIETKLQALGLLA